MNYNELLNQYLDGDLGEMEQQELFSAIAENDELRQEFNDEILVRNGVRSSVIDETPPIELSNAIFSAVGYSGSVAATAAATSSTAVYAGHIAKFGGYLLSFAVGCVAVYLWNSLGVSVNETSNIATKEPNRQIQQFRGAAPVAEPQNIAKNNNAQNNSNMKFDRQSQILHKTEIVQFDDKNISTENIGSHFTASQQFSTKEDISEFQSTANNESIINNQLSIKSAEMYSSNINTTISKNIPIVPLQFGGVPSKTLPSSLPMKDIMVSVRSLQTIPTTENIATNDRLGINNIAFAALYCLDNRFSVGLEGGREPFYQEYTLQLDTATIHVKQNPTLWWGGALFRGEAPELGWKEILYPFAQLGAGLAESGGYVRTSGGICFAPHDVVSMNIGFDWTMLQYSAYNLQYNAQKIGWSYSVNIRF